MPVEGSSLPNGPEPCTPFCDGSGVEPRDRRRGPAATPPAAGLAGRRRRDRTTHAGGGRSFLLPATRQCMRYTTAPCNPEEAAGGAVVTAGSREWAGRLRHLGRPQASREILHGQE